MGRKREKGEERRKTREGGARPLLGRGSRIADADVAPANRSGQRSRSTAPVNGPGQRSPANGPGTGQPLLQTVPAPGAPSSVDFPLDPAELLGIGNRRGALAEPAPSLNPKSATLLNGGDAVFPNAAVSIAQRQSLKALGTVSLHGDLVRNRVSAECRRQKPMPRWCQVRSSGIISKQLRNCGPGTRTNFRKVRKPGSGSNPKNLLY